MINELTDRLNGIELVEKSLSSDETSDEMKTNENISRFVAINLFGSKGSGNREFNTPRNIAVDQHNNIIVCDLENQRIQFINQKGDFIRSERIEGVIKGEFDRIHAASVDRDGNIVMFGFDSRQFIIFDPVKRQIIHRFGGKVDKDFTMPDCQTICVDHCNRIVACDTNNHKIKVFDHFGNRLLCFGRKGSKDGQFKFPVGVTVNKNNDIIVCDTYNHRIQVFDKNGKHLVSFGSKGLGKGLFERSTRAAVDHENNIFVTDWATFKVQKFDPQGNWISSFGCHGWKEGQFLHPQGIVVDRLNRIIVSDVGRHSIQIFSEEKISNDEM